MYQCDSKAQIIICCLLLAESYKSPVMRRIKLKLVILACRIMSKAAKNRIAHKKGRIKVLFLVSNLGMWKSNSLFEKLLYSVRFDPIIFPFYDGRITLDEFIKVQYSILAYFKQLEYPCVEGYEESKRIFVNVEKYNPDIIFFQQPYTIKISQLNAINLLRGTLFCYIPYTTMNENSKRIWDTTLQNIAYRIYYPTEIHRREAEN